MNLTERIYQTVKCLPEQQIAEILDFAETVKARYSAPLRPAATAEQTPVEFQPMPSASVTECVRRSYPAVTVEQHAALLERMRAITAAQPMTQTTVEIMRREARY